ncbi:hypothetical protein [Paenibacillus sp. R14(2021)]|uniref:hypothetical protein n=1 Tax=Paenibacillus sp. R14(2021) TaxID=2859228 RepID=UPI001C616A54|nr:hypothetical protein [Paenibacillus sp. R14(2021)]
MLQHHEMKWFAAHEEVKALFQTTLNCEVLLAVSRNEELVAKVDDYARQYSRISLAGGNQSGKLIAAKGYRMPPKEMVIPDPDAKEWIYVVFDHTSYLKVFAGPVGANGAVEWSSGDAVTG